MLFGPLSFSSSQIARLLQRRRLNSPQSPARRNFSVFLWPVTEWVSQFMQTVYSQFRLRKVFVLLKLAQFSLISRAKISFCSHSTLVPKSTFTKSHFSFRKLFSIFRFRFCAKKCFFPLSSLSPSSLFHKLTHTPLHNTPHNTLRGCSECQSAEIQDEGGCRAGVTLTLSG